ncbi:MAG: YcaO-like family protein [Candidatus Aenigmarchaeota archaeon]|nr:YcaO-like family protein [Candidatus Aenigmarchaeota archaeon]
MLDSNTIFDTKEIDKKDAIKQLEKLIGECNIIEKIWRLRYFNDEPKFPLFGGKIRDTKNISDAGEADRLVSGLGMTEDRAKIKTLGEAVERFCLAVYRKKDFIYGSHKEIKNSINPLSFATFDNETLKKQNIMFSDFNENTKFNWVKGVNLSTLREAFIPAHMVYIPYNFENEKVIQFPITNGAAAGTSFTGAIYRGICELIERDAFMINYLNKLPAKKIIVDDIDNVHIQDMIYKFKNYRLEPYLFLLETDLNVPTVLTILVDKTGIGPSISLGLRSGFDIEENIISSMEEAQQSRPWLRKEILKKNEMNEKQNIKTILDRGLFWFDVKMIKELNYLLKSDRKISISSLKYKKKLSLKDIIKNLKNNNINSFFVDITQPEIKKIGFTVVKVICPELQPLFFDEDFKIISNRVFTVPEKIGFKKLSLDKLNNVPHPFL